jgi:hypothetical protein
MVKTRVTEGSVRRVDFGMNPEPVMIDLPHRYSRISADVVFSTWDLPFSTAS